MSLYSMLSIKAMYDAVMMFSDTPTVSHESSLSRDSIKTRVFAAVAACAFNIRTL